MMMDYQTYLVDDILQKVDRATMSTALEGREPFLDQHIIEWAAQLPSDYKYHNGQKKYILKQGLKIRKKWPNSNKYTDSAVDWLILLVELKQPKDNKDL